MNRLEGTAWGVAAVLLAAGAMAGPAQADPDHGKGPEIRTERVQQAQEAEERARARARRAQIKCRDEEHPTAETALSAEISLWGETGEAARVVETMCFQQEAWNAGSIEVFMEGYWKSDELRFASGGSVTKGWQATLDRYKKRYSDREKMGTLNFSDLDVNVLSEDSAIVFGRWTLQRKDDKPTGLFTLLFRKIDGKWVIVHDHTSSE